MPADVSPKASYEWGTPSKVTTVNTTSREPVPRETFSRRSVFILAAIGSAIGLGNIWRFPYVSYTNGGGAFLIPYVVALMTAGIPLLLMEYGLGHKFRGSGPLAFRRLHKRGEFAGWFQVGIAFLIALYYPVIIAWALRYAIYSFGQEWGSDPAAFFNNHFLQEASGFSVDLVAQVALPMLVVWGIIVLVVVLGVENGIGRLNRFFVPLLVILFGALVIRALFLPGAAHGLEVFFTPDWEALRHGGVWIAAYGQIFFSLNVGFAVMITYSSYLKRKTNLVGSGYVVAFSNASFEALAGIGVFATLGFLATSTGQSVSEVAGGGIGLAFIAFPTIISTMPCGTIFGVIFFTCLTIAGLTSEISVVEVCISAIRDKFGLARWAATIAVIVPLLVGSMLLFPTTTGSHTLDIFDKFVCSIGIVSAAIIAMLVISWVLRALPALSTHLNAVSSRHVGFLWKLCVAVVTPAILLTILGTEIHSIVTGGYGDYPTWSLLAFGWIPILIVLIGAIVFTLMPWSSSTPLEELSLPKPTLNSTPDSGSQILSTEPPSPPENEAQ